MGSGIFPMYETEIDCARLVNAHINLKAFIDEWKRYVGNSDCCNGQFDNAAYDGKIFGGLELALELMEKAIVRKVEVKTLPSATSTEGVK